MYLHKKISTMYLLCSYCIATWDRFGGMGRFKGGLRCKGWVNSVIINVITEINYRCNYMQVFLKYKYNVKTCTLSALYQMIHLNVSTS